MLKQANLSFSVAAQSFGDDVTSIQFSTQDKNTAKLIFTIKEGKQPLNLTDVEGTVDLVMGDKSIFEDNKATVTAPLDGKLEYTITADQIRHPGRARGELQLIGKDGQSIGGFRFNFTVKKALVDEYAGPVKDYYVNDLEAVKQEVKKKAESTATEMDNLIAEIEETAESIQDFDVVRVDMELREKATKQEVQQVTARLTETNQRIEQIITTPIEGVSAQEIIDARQGEISLGEKIANMQEEINGFTNLLTSDNEPWEVV